MVFIILKLFLHTGYNLWTKLNQLFEHLPLAAVIDSKVFCVHGGIPRDMAARNLQVLPEIAKVQVFTTSELIHTDSKTCFRATITIHF